MKAEHAAWIAEYVARFDHPAATLGRCVVATNEMHEVFPELRIVKGHVHCPPPWGKRAHWWLVDPDGQIVDPTAAQFTRGIDCYEEYCDGDPVRLGSCMNCGTGIWGDPERGRPTFCSPECEVSTADYLSRSRS